MEGQKQEVSLTHNQLVAILRAQKLKYQPTKAERKRAKAAAKMGPRQMPFIKRKTLMETFEEEIAASRARLNETLPVHERASMRKKEIRRFARMIAPEELKP
jgi:hypothetical protein